MKCSNWREREEVKEMGGELIHKTVTIWKLYACVYFDNLTGYKKIIRTQQATYVQVSVITIIKCNRQEVIHNRSSKHNKTKYLVNNLMRNM